MVQHGSIAMVYDGDGNRVAKTVGGATTSYLVDTNSVTGFSQVLEEMQGGSVVRVYSYGFQLLNERQTVNGSAMTSFYGFDGHGSVRFLMDSTGAVTDTYDYDAFGNLVGLTGTTPNNYRFAGEQFDPDLNLYYNRARYLDATSGRFWTMDERYGSDLAPLRLHKYLYAGANPVGNVDPSGYLFLSSLYYGRVVHKKIGEEYNKVTGGCSDGQVFFLARGECFRLFGLGGPDAFRVDLANPIKTFDIFEIKPINSATQAIPQLLNYLGYLKLLDQRPDANWHPGLANEFTATSPIEINKTTLAYVAAPVLGAIIYYVVDTNEPVFDAALLTAGLIAKVLGDIAAKALIAAQNTPSVAKLVQYNSQAQSAEEETDLEAAELDASVGVD
jgi:RHS repeat-associated protein